MKIRLYLACKNIKSSLYVPCVLNQLNAFFSLGTFCTLYFCLQVVLACSVAVSQAVWNGPLAGGQPAHLYPAGVSPQACPNFPNCNNPAVAANPQQPAAHQWGAQPQWNAQPNQWNAQPNQWNAQPNQWNQVGNKFN